MTGHHPVTTGNDTDTIPMFPALNRLERRPELQPRRWDREPYWRAPITPPSRNCFIPSWNWYNPRTADIPEGEQRLTLDANGAYLGAMGAITIAHSGLSHTGAVDWQPSPREIDPGYYLIDIPHWNFSGTIVSPLGDSSRLETESRVWIAHPTLILLLELAEEGFLGAVDIRDSYIARATTDFRRWVAHLKQVRAERLDAIEQAHTDTAKAVMVEKYTAFKEGYSAALSMMLTGEKCQTRRPDWTHAVYAQHAATMWRKGWRWTFTGRPLLGMGHTDELTVLASDLPEAMMLPKKPFRFDPSGRTLGALKPKSLTEQAEPADTPPAHLVLGDDEDGDIL